MSDVWRDALAALINRLETIYFTSRQFNQLIGDLLARDNCPMSGLTYEVMEQDPFKTLNFGVSAIGTPDINSIELGDTNRRCRISQYLKQPPFPKPSDLNRLLEQLFVSFWKPSFRTPSAGMLDLKRSPQANAMAQQTIEICVSEEKNCVFMFCDLDGFKALNDSLGQEAGNRVIKEFGALLECNLQPSAVLLHAGGDEFFALLPDINSTEAIMLAHKVSEAVTEYDFKVNSSVSISCGIASTEENDAIKNYNWLYSRAESALKQNAKQRTKGKARFYSKDPFKPGEGTSSRDILVSNCIVKSTLPHAFPFSSAWLNCLSSIVVEGLRAEPDITRVTKRVDSFLKWAQVEPPVDAGRLVSASSRADGLYAAPSFLAIDIAFAVIHGFFRWGLLVGHGLLPSTSIRLQYAGDGRHAKVSLSDGTSVWTSSLSDPMPNCFEIGNLWNRPTDGELPVALARAILIQIGHDQPKIPLDLFLERIIVDDRPTVGGGLPDFWEATLARLVVQILRHPNAGAVYVIGNHHYGKQTVENLRMVASWAIRDEQLAYKTGLSVSQIREAAKYLDGKIHFPDGEDQLIVHLSDLLRSPHPFGPTQRAPSIRPAPFLRRELKLDNLGLNREDGCRVRTIAEAYPVVLEIARKAGANETITDQAGQKLRELIDFKVHLLAPSENLIPAFYKSEEDSFKEYYETQFVSHEGLFGRVFHGTEQLESVLAHLEYIIKTPGQHFSTRRAILVIPNEAKVGKKLSPLGLVSIRIIPRFLGTRPNLSFSYTWRTVEALKGFPYSLYGSVKFSQHIINLLAARLPKEVARQVEFGTVSYIAHSLHFFLDDYGQNIARLIVDEASF
ncbi:MAG: diguanylate cyclase [Nitrospira sp.]